MSICIVQLSDIHFKSAATVSTAVRESVIGLLRPAVRGKKWVLIAVTGDLAFRGLSEEYEAASAFLGEIKAEVEHEVQCSVQIVVVPGNHDCDFQNVSNSRDMIAKTILLEGVERIDQGVIENCTSVQKAFNESAKLLEATSYVFDDGLWKEIDFDVEGRRIKVFGLNVAWLSKIKEKYGELVFPSQGYEDRFRASTANLNIVLMHHPAHWMVQHSFHSLKSLFQKDNTLVLSGHEHVSGGYEIRSAEAEYVSIEAPALVPEKSDDKAGFNVLEIDLDQRSGVCQTYYLGNELAHEQFEFKLQAPAEVASRHQLGEVFSAELSDPGGNFTGGSYGGNGKNRLALADIFTFPDVRTITAEEGALPVISSEVLIKGACSGRRVIITGHELSGKTTLLYRAFRTYHSRGQYPVYISASNFNNAGERQIRNKIRDAVEHQYKDGAAVLRERKESLVLLIDDIEVLRRIPNLFKNVMEVAAADFEHLIATAEQQFNLTELLDSEVRKLLSDAYTYEILPFGHRNRYQLVGRWCRVSEVSDVQELERKVHQVEATLDTVIGRNLAPAYPFYLLLILQGMESATAGALQQSSYAYYYQHLITKGLSEAGLKQDKHDEVMNYLANLAWFVRGSGEKEITEIQLQGFNEAFGKNFHNVLLADRLTLLTNARLLVKRKDVYFFAYPYIYHFFLGAYLSDNFDDAQAKRTINDMCANLRDRESANSILFLTHHKKSLEIIQKVVDVLASCHRDSKPFNFEKDADGIHELITESSRLSLGALDLEQERLDQRDHMDLAAKNHEKFDVEVSNDKTELGERLRQILLMHRTGEIVGQIVKNYYGSLKRPEKKKLLREVFEAPLRMFSSLMTMMGNNPSLLADGISQRIKEEYPDSESEELKRISRRLAFDLLGMVATAAVLKPARDVSIRELDDDINALVEEDNTLSVKLAQISCSLVRPAYRGTDDLKRLAADLKVHNTFAYSLLQSLGAMHIRMFSLSEPDKQKLCSALDIDLPEVRKAEAATSGMKKLK